jgi:glycerol uptake facilitator-like aquaporin
MNLTRKLAAEFLGTAFLLAIVVGSGIMGENLSGGNRAIALLANSIATGAGLAFLILSFGDVSGAHFNPVVSLTEAWRENIGWREGGFYLAAQTAGAFFGVGIANLMFDLPMFFASTKIRAGSSQFLSEFVATFGLVGVIQTGVKFRPNLVFLMVAAYITAAYWFTASTSFANPAVTLARSASNTFAGINPGNVPMFIIAQVFGAFSATIVLGWLLKDEKNNNK